MAAFDDIILFGEGLGVLQRIVDREPFRSGCREQGVIGGDKHGRREPIGLKGVPDGERAGQMQRVIRPQGMGLHEGIGLGHARRRDRHQAVPASTVVLHAPGQALGLGHRERPFPYLALQRTEHFRVCQEGRIDALPYWVGARAPGVPSASPLRRRSV